jgi:uncharacterized protein YabE (DUF348 family)
MIPKSAWDKSKRLARRQKRRIKILLKGNPVYVPVIAGFSLILLAFVLLLIFGNAKQIQVTPNSRIVIVTHDGIKQVVPSNDHTVGTLLDHLHIHLGTGDVVQPNLTTPIYQDDFRINIYRALPVAIVQKGSVNYTFSAATTPRAIANQAGVTVYPADDVTAVPNQNFLQNGAVGQQIVINPATPINLNLYGTPVAIRTHAQTVADLIKEENIHLAPTDQVMPTSDTALTPNEQVFIIRQGVKIQTVTQTIPTPVQTVYVSNLAYGTSSVVQQGSPGQETITYQQNTKNGVVVSSTPIQTIITTPPVTEIVDVGNSLSGIQGDMALAGISPSDYTYVDYIVSHESGWCPTKAQGEHSCPAVPDNQYTSGGYGLCQATPGTKMEPFGSDWATNPITQLRWCNSYANSTYGSWYSAYLHWTNYHWW